MSCCVCGCSKVENRELSLCATCNKARLVAERPAVVKQRKPLNPISASRAAHLCTRQAAYREVKKTQDSCACCGTVYDLTPSHVLTQKKFKQHAANPLNVIVLCSEHHHEWEHNKASFCLHFPNIWNRKMEIMEALAPEYFQQFKQKHSTLFQNGQSSRIARSI